MSNGRDAKLWKLETSAGVQAVNWRSIVLDAQGQVDKFTTVKGKIEGCCSRECNTSQPQ